MPPIDLSEADLSRSLLISKQLMKILLNSLLKTTACTRTMMSMLCMKTLISVDQAMKNSATLLLIVSLYGHTVTVD